MSLLVSSGRLLRLHTSGPFSSVRAILTAAYGCEESWKQRLNQPLLAKVKPESFFTEISQRYTKKLKVGAVDIDVFANVVTHQEQLDELEHLLVKLRKTRRSKDTLESTHHAVCKSYFNLNAHDRLLKILENKIEYGIFPDIVCYNILMNHFIEAGNFRDAAKVATLIMLQEEFSNQITNRLALYSTYKYISDPELKPWLDIDPSEVSEEAAAEEGAEDEDDEENIKYIRVPRLRNPFHDDHFDITDPTKLCGKTLYLFGKQFKDIGGQSCQLLGLALFEKWAEASELLDRMKKSSDATAKLFTKDSIDRITETVNALSDEVAESKQAATAFLEKLQTLASRVSSDSLEQLLHHKLDDVPLLEESDKQDLTSKFAEWEKSREAAVKQQLRDLLREERIKEIEAKRQELEEREKVLFFFENSTRHEYDHAKAEERIRDLKLGSQVDEEYVPPKIRN